MRKKKQKIAGFGHGILCMRTPIGRPVAIGTAVEPLDGSQKAGFVYDPQLPTA